MSASQKPVAHLDNGVQVAYLDEGLGAPVLFLHGCPFYSFVWRDVIDELSAEFRMSTAATRSSR